MTDDTEEHESEHAETTVAVGDAVVPEGTEWELATQIPFHEGEQHELTSTIIVAVAETEGVSPLDIKDPQLYEVVDIPAMEAVLLGSDTIGESENGLKKVEFMYRDHRIVVRSDAWIQVFESSGL